MRTGQIWRFLKITYGGCSASRGGGGVCNPGRVSAQPGENVCSWEVSAAVGGFPSISRGVNDRHCLLRGVSTSTGGWYPSMHWGRHPPVNRMTNRCKNITLATTSLRAGKNVFSKWMRASQIWRFLKVTYECSLICCVKLSISDSQKIQPIENPFSIFLWDDGFPINFPGVNDRHFIDEEWGWGIHQPGWGSFSWLCRYT